MEENDVDRSDARNDVYKSHQSEIESDDYGDDEYYKSQKTKKSYVPVFVPQEETKKSKFAAYFRRLISDVILIA